MTAICDTPLGALSELERPSWFTATASTHALISGSSPAAVRCVTTQLSARAYLDVSHESGFVYTPHRYIGRKNELAIKSVKCLLAAHRRIERMPIALTIRHGTSWVESTCIVNPQRSGPYPKGRKLCGMRHAVNFIVEHSNFLGRVFGQRIIGSKEKVRQYSNPKSLMICANPYEKSRCVKVIHLAQNSNTCVAIFPWHSSSRLCI